MFAPEDRRRALLAVLVLNQELARVPDIVSEPVTGLIRFQWWRDALAELAGGRPREHPVLAGLAPAASLPEAIDLAQELVDHREADLDGVGPATLAELERHARDRSGLVQRLWAVLLGARERRWLEPAEAAGTAFGLSGGLRSLARHARQGRTLLPQAELATAGITEEDLAAGSMSPALGVVTGRVAGRVEDLLGKVREAGRPPRPLVPALLPAVLAGRELRRLHRAGNDPFAMAAKPAGGLDPVHLWLAALTRRV